MTTYTEIREEQFAWARAKTDVLLNRLDVDLTPSQKDAIFDVMKEVASVALVGYGKEKELKEIEIQPLHKESSQRGTIVVFVKAGAVDDEGTIGQLTRPTQQFFIGRNGGITWNECRKKSSDSVRHYGRSNLYTAFSYSPFRMFV